MLTGSASKGRSNFYYYYHCIASCGCRFKAEVVNEAFINQLKKFKPHQAVVSLYKNIINKAYKSRHSQQQSGSKQMIDDISKLNEKIARGRELLLAGDIEAGDYRTIKNSSEEQIYRLEAKLSEIATKSTSTNSIDQLLDKAINTLSHIDELYIQADIDKKREIIGSIFIEKVCFDGNECRTTKVNEAVQCIYQINNELCTMKNRKVSDISQLSCLVERTGIEPVIPP
jgi:site-specific DNA recombinase